MDKKKGLLNVTVSVGFKILTMVMVIFVRRVLIQACGNEVNGLNSLYISIISFLCVAELGVGSAITFCMYKPIVDGNNDQVSALYHLFRKMYLLIGSIILLAGLAIAPFIHLLAKDYAELDVNLYFTFVLMLISVVLTYVFSAKTALFNAHKNNYITTSITSGGILLQYVLQIIVLILTGSFAAYLLCRIIAVMVQWLVTELLVRKKYAFIIKNKQKLDRENKTKLTKSIKAMFMHLVGYVLVNTVDSIVISVFIGVVVLGKYSNYLTIVTSMVAVLNMVFESLTSVVGHLYVSETNETTQKYCGTFYSINFMMGTVFFLGCYAVIDNLIAILFSPELLMDRSISFVIILNYFVQFMRKTVLLFRNATGTFYYDRWKPPVEGLFNLVLSILFVKSLGVVGVLIATIVTNLLICHVVEPYVLYKHAFSASPLKYYIKNFAMIAIFAIALCFMQSIMLKFESHWKEFFANGFISLGISGLVCAVVLCYSRDVRLILKEKLLGQ